MSNTAHSQTCNVSVDFSFTLNDRLELQDIDEFIYCVRVFIERKQATHPCDTDLGWVCRTFPTPDRTETGVRIE